MSAQPQPNSSQNMRVHQATTVRNWKPIRATESLIYSPKVSFRRGNNEIHVRANAIPLHKVGRFTVTKEYPEGTYAYFLTEQWPVIPRYFRAKPLKLRGDRNRP
ncbi:MAG: YHYH protein [Verrucomicrobiota bacterium]|nr:YHYH protein [Verrucomicrobiota bacterium]MEC8332915.1 YHYH protein [Verrucomicrobiota bacterium]